MAVAALYLSLYKSQFLEPVSYKKWVCLHIKAFCCHTLLLIVSWLLKAAILW